MALHPSLEAVGALIGTWRGPGRGEYPTIASFEYSEDVTFTDVGKPFLHYVQRTQSPEGAPMHTETGFLRVSAAGVVEFVLAQPTGQTELAEGPLETRPDGFSCALRSQIVNSGSAKHVEATIRRVELTGDALRTTFAMAAVDVPMTHHLSSELRRVG